MDAEQKFGECRHCGQTGAHRLVWRYQRWNEPPFGFPQDLALRLQARLESSEVFLQDSGTHPSVYIAICESCLDVLLYVNEPYHDDLTDSFEGSWDCPTKLVWPPQIETPQSLPDGVPERVRELHDEAQRVRARSTASFAVNVRRALEAIATERGYAVGPLHQRLQQMAFKGVLPPVLAEASGLLRVVGNKGAHAEDDVSADEAEQLDRFFRLLLDYLYIVPAELAQLTKGSSGSGAPSSSSAGGAVQ